MKTRLIITLFLGMLMLTSCKSPEEKVISKLQNLTERIEKNGSKFTADDWQDALEDLADIHEDMQDCDFTNEQLKAIGKADAQLTAVIASQASKTLSNEVSNFINNAGSFIQGLKEGAESFNMDDFNESSEEILNALKSVEEELK